MDCLRYLGLFVSIIELAIAQSNPTSITSGAVSLATTATISASIFNTAPNSTTTSYETSRTSSSAATIQTTTDSDDDGHVHSQEGLVNYYFVFLALILCVASLGFLLLYRRKKRVRLAMRASRQSALAEDLHSWHPARGRRRYWQGRWRSTHNSREEGLNEEGEAPPPYVPKSQENASTAENSVGPAIPLSTLSRQQAGLKPPEYSETALPSPNLSRPTSANHEGDSTTPARDQDR